MRSEVRYARSGDLSIAYQVLGKEGPDLVFVPGFVSHLDLAWEEPSFARSLRGLASISRLIWFDERGTEEVFRPDFADLAKERWLLSALKDWGFLASPRGLRRRSGCCCWPDPRS